MWWPKKAVRTIDDENEPPLTQLTNLVINKLPKTCYQMWLVTMTTEKTNHKSRKSKGILTVPCPVLSSHGRRVLIIKKEMSSRGGSLAKPRHAAESEYETNPSARKCAGHSSSAENLLP